MALSDAAVEKAADALYVARTQGRLIDGLPADARPGTLEEAYRIQDRFIGKLGRHIGGYFSGCTNPVIQERLGLDGPYSARLFDGYIRQSPAIVSASEFPPIILECEFVFVLGQNLPSRQRIYTRDEVASAVGTVHPGIELVAGHLENWPDQDIYSIISDNGTDGALFYGPANAPQKLDCSQIAVALLVNGTKVQTGHGRNVLGDPLNALTWLVNDRIARGDDLKAGQFFSTGSTTPMQPVGKGDAAIADFGPLGRVELSIV